MARLDPDTRYMQILEAALVVAARVGYNNITREGIAKEAECAPALVSHYFGTVDDARDAVMNRAVETKQLTVLAEGLAIGHPLAKAAPLTLKRRAAKILIGV